MIIINYEEIATVLKVEDLFKPIKQAFIDYNSPSLIGVPVNLLHFPDNADTHIKIAAIKGYDYFSVKVVSMFPNNVRFNISPYSGAIYLFDGKTGFPAAILNDKGIITDIRTAAAGALITDFTANKMANKVSVIGTGIQAYHQIIALEKFRTLEQVTIYGRNPDKAHLLKEKLSSSLKCQKILIAGTPEKAVKESQIIITTTSSENPLILGKWLQKGHHITAVGSDDIYKNEIDLDCFTKADKIFVDSLELNKAYGEYAHAIQKHPDLINKTIEFGNAFKEKYYQPNKDHITVAKLVGVGIQDLATSIAIMQKLQ